LPLLFILVGYFSSHLDNSAGTFFLQLLACELVYWMSASYGMIISTAIKQFDVALALVPVLIIPQMLVSGFFISLNQVPKFFYWLEYLSMFKYGYEAAINNQYKHPVDCGDGVYCNLL
jgi:ATP-binding cassette subfamily G (WHITE) protein 1